MLIFAIFYKIWYNSILKSTQEVNNMNMLGVEIDLSSMTPEQIKEAIQKTELLLASLKHLQATQKKAARNHSSFSNSES